MGVFAVVYLVGGIVYQRTVMHARGWRQIPHYHAWSAALGFIWVRLFAMPLLFLLRTVSRVAGCCGNEPFEIPASSESRDAVNHNKRSDDGEWA